MDENFLRELVRKYQWAGKIRFVSFLLLFLFLLSMKLAGGYAYLNTFLVGLLFVEAILNQPYSFFLKRVNLYRFQFYQMMVDIIIISWVVYYMGGIDAQVVGIAYFAVILWAGVVSGPAAVFFAVITSCFFFSLAVLLEHFRILPPVSYFPYEVSTAQMFSALLGNVAFMFAFGYFSAHSSSVIRFLEKKRFEESLKFTHKFLATGYLFGGIAHDVINHLASIRGYARILLEKIGRDTSQDKELSNKQMLESIQRLESENIELLSRLSRFSLKQKEQPQPTDLHSIIEDALTLTLPFAQTFNVSIERLFEKGPLLVVVDKGQIQEALVTLIISTIEAMPAKGKITIKTASLKEDNCAQVVLQGSGLSLKQDYLKRITGSFFTVESQPETKNRDLGFAIAQDIIARYKGKIDIESLSGEGTAIAIRLPQAQIANLGQ